MASSCRRKHFFSIVQNVMSIRRPYKKNESTYLILHTSNWFQLIWKMSKAILSKALHFRPVQKITFVVHLVRINSCSRGTGMRHTLYNTAFSDKIPTRSTGYSRDCKLSKHSVELTETCLDLGESSSFPSAKCRSQRTIFH